MTASRAHAHDPGAPALRRLLALNPALDEPALAALRLAMARTRTVRPHRELMTEGRDITETQLVIDGWAARVRQLADGRRQIMNFILPGDLIGLCDYDRPVASSTIVAITPVTVCTAPDRSVSPGLDRAYAISRAMDEAHLMAQITRLGRLNAHERIADLLLELLERLSLVGLAAGGRFVMPLTQEVVADALGLTSVHVNRMLQQARRAGELIWSGRDLMLTAPDELRGAIGRNAVQVVRAFA